MSLTSVITMVAVASLSVALPGLSAEPAVHNASYVEPGGGRVLQLTIDIDAAPRQGLEGLCR